MSQAKRWTDKTVGRQDIQAIRWCVGGDKTSKSVFITNGQFSKEAASYVERLRQRVVLIKGYQTRRSDDRAWRASHQRTYEIKRIDEDYFNTTDLLLEGFAATRRKVGYVSTSLRRGRLLPVCCPEGEPGTAPARRR
jgi:restriction system protein